MSETGYYVDAEYDSDISSMSGSGELCQWQTDPPTESGWYWIRNQWPQSFCAWVSVGVRVESVGHIGALWNISEITHWLGPLPMPEMPK